MKKVLLLLILFLSLADGLLAEHPIEVQRKAASGDHYEAVLSFEKIPDRKLTPEARIAAAKSYWALGLHTKAKDIFETLSREKQLSATQQAEVEISQAVIEHQEHNYQVAILFAERATKRLQEGPLRSKAWLVWGDSLSALHEYGSAEGKYELALKESHPSHLAEVHFRLGETSVNLGKLYKAKGYYEKVPLDSERIPECMRALAKINLKLKNYEHAAFWLQKGQSEFPDFFLDSWVDYAEVVVAQSKGDLEQVRKLRQKAEKKYPPSDPWLTLLQASAESFEWQENEKVKNNQKAMES